MPSPLALGAVTDDLVLKQDSPWGRLPPASRGDSCSQRQGVPRNYGSNQGGILKQADGYFLLSVVVVTCNPYAEYTETFSAVFLNCHHNFTMEVAIAR